MIKNFQKCFAEIKGIEMKKLYNKFLGDLEKMKSEYDKNDDELVEITPEDIRIRKKYLTEIDRRRHAREIGKIESEM